MYVYLKSDKCGPCQNMPMIAFFNFIADRMTIPVDVIVTLLHYLHLLSHSNSKNLQYLLCSSNYLTASLATLLFHCDDEVVHGNVLCLLQSIICVKEFSENLEIWNLFSEGYEGLQKDIDIIEAVIDNNTGRQKKFSFAFSS